MLAALLLRADVLSHRLIDVQAGRLIRAADLELRQRGGEWVLAGVDTSRRRHRLPGLSAAREPGQHPFRDWSRFDPLIGQTSIAGLRGPFGRIRRLKPAQIADLLQEASKEEETEILGEVHKDPELEADVFEELDEDLATRLPGARTDEDIAGVLARMRADDAADAIAELLPRRHFKNALRRLRDGSSWRRRACVGRGQGSTGEHGRHVRGSRRQSAGDRI